jgi:hypothetical protein
MIHLKCTFAATFVKFVCTCFDQAYIVDVQKSRYQNGCPRFCLQGRSAKYLEDFKRHALVVNCSRETVVAHYATEMSGPLNDDRFKPGMIAQKVGGIIWKAWLIVETTLVGRYMDYLLSFADYEERAKCAKEALDEARSRWVDDQLERRFRKSKAFRRSQA